MLSKIIYILIDTGMLIAIFCLLWMSYRKLREERKRVKELLCQARFQLERANYDLVVQHLACSDRDVRKLAKKEIAKRKLIGDLRGTIEKQYKRLHS